MTKSALITGCDGFIAKHLIDYLLAKNYYIYAGYYKKKPQLYSKNLKIIKLNVTNNMQVLNALKISKPNVIYHLAAKSLPSFSFKFPKETIKVNINGTLNIFENCRKLKIKPKIIVACSSGQFGARNLKNLPLRENDIQSPEHIYGLSKVFQELISKQYVKMYGLKIIISIIFNTTGPGKKGDVFTDFCKQFQNQRGKKQIRIKVGNLNNYRDFLHVKDVCRALYILSLKGKVGSSYNICTSKYIKISEIISLMKKFSSKKIQIVKDKKLMRKFDEKYIFGSYKKIKKIGWKPVHSTEKIFKDICEYYKKKH